ncbi:MAG: hypothetical protein WC389_18000 [Lutibacter sp.]|jgi:hypothetical protein
MKKKLYIALNIHRGECEVGGIRTKVNLPSGCDGIFFGFNTKKAAREFWNKNVELLEVVIAKGKK